MKPSKQFEHNPLPQQESRARAPHLRLVESATAAGDRPWWVSRWPLVTAIAWAVLLGTVSTWWWLNQLGAN